MTCSRPQIRYLAWMGTGHTPSRSHPEYWEDCTVPWLTLADVHQLRDGTRSVIHDTSEKISLEGIRNSSAVPHPVGTVAMSRTASVGFTCIMGTTMATSQDFVTWTCGDRLDNRFLLWALRGERAQILSRMQGSTHKTIYMPDLEDLRISLPSLVEQRAIADYLDAETSRIDALIAKKQQLIHLLAERWGSELRALLRLDGDRVALRRLFEPSIGGSWGSEPGTADVDAACVRGTDFDMGSLRVADTCPNRSYASGDFASKCLRSGDLVIEKSGGGENQPVGRAVLFEGAGPAVPTNFAARLRPRPGSVPEYLVLLLNAAYRQGITRSWIKQTTGIQNLDLGGLLSEKVPLPSESRQRELLAKLKQRDEQRRSVVGQLFRQIDLLAEHRQALITAAVTGELSAQPAV